MVGQEIEQSTVDDPCVVQLKLKLRQHWCQLEELDEIAHHRCLSQRRDGEGRQ